MSKKVGALTWAWAIIVGGILITPGGIDPIVTRIAGAISIVLGVASFAANRRSTTVQ